MRKIELVPLCFQARIKTNKPKKKWCEHMWHRLQVHNVLQRRTQYAYLDITQPFWHQTKTLKMYGYEIDTNESTQKNRGDTKN